MPDGYISEDLHRPRTPTTLHRAVALSVEGKTYIDRDLAGDTDHVVDPAIREIAAGMSTLLVRNLRYTTEQDGTVIIYQRSGRRLHLRLIGVPVAVLEGITLLEEHTDEAT